MKLERTNLDWLLIDSKTIIKTKWQDQKSLEKYSNI